MPPGSVSSLVIGGLSIVLIDLLLAGDNALVIAMAVRSLSERQRRIAIRSGAAAAVALRIVVTIVAARLLGIEFLKIIGGVLVLWIAIKVLSDTHAHGRAVPAQSSLLQAIWLIVFADITMSVDNVLAIAGAARGSIPLIIFGLGVSIPLVVFSSNLIAKMMDRYPIVVYIGAAILGRVGGEMIMTDPWVTSNFHPSDPAIWICEAALIVLILVAGRILGRRRPPPPMQSE
jgi:YjbE family integral membrane protein